MALLIKELKVLVDKMEGYLEASDREIYQTLDNDFHHVFFKACGNNAISKLYDKHQSVIVATRLRNLRKEKITKHVSFDQHKVILELLEDNDLDAAIKILEGHIVNYARESFVEPANL